MLKAEKYTKAQEVFQLKGTTDSLFPSRWPVPPTKRVTSNLDREDGDAASDSDSSASSSSSSLITVAALGVAHVLLPHPTPGDMVTEDHTRYSNGLHSTVPPYFSHVSRRDGSWDAYKTESGHNLRTPPLDSDDDWSCSESESPVRSRITAELNDSGWRQGKDSVYENVDLETVTVSVEDFVFRPASLSIPPGTTVVFLPRGKVTTHKLSCNGLFETVDLEGLPAGSPLTVTFDQLGEYIVTDDIFSFMRCVIRVGLEEEEEEEQEEEESPPEYEEEGAEDAARALQGVGEEWEEDPAGKLVSTQPPDPALGNTLNLNRNVDIDDSSALPFLPPLPPPQYLALPGSSPTPALRGRSFTHSTVDSPTAVPVGRLRGYGGVEGGDGVGEGMKAMTIRGGRVYGRGRRRALDTVEGGEDQDGVGSGSGEEGEEERGGGAVEREGYRPIVADLYERLRAKYGEEGLGEEEGSGLVGPEERGREEGNGSSAQFKFMFAVADFTETDDVDETTNIADVGEGEGGGGGYGRSGGDDVVAASTAVNPVPGVAGVEGGYTSEERRRASKNKRKKKKEKEKRRRDKKRKEGGVGEGEGSGSEPSAEGRGHRSLSAEVVVMEEPSPMPETWTSTSTGTGTGYPAQKIDPRLKHVGAILSPETVGDLSRLLQDISSGAETSLSMTGTLARTGTTDGEALTLPDEDATLIEGSIPITSGYRLSTITTSRALPPDPDDPGGAPLPTVPDRQPSGGGSHSEEKSAGEGCEFDSATFMASDSSTVLKTDTDGLPEGVPSGRVRRRRAEREKRREKERERDRRGTPNLVIGTTDDVAVTVIRDGDSGQAVAVDGDARQAVVMDFDGRSTVAMDGDSVIVGNRVVGTLSVEKEDGRKGRGPRRDRRGKAGGREQQRPSSDAAGGIRRDIEIDGTLSLDQDGPWSGMAGKASFDSEVEKTSGQGKVGEPDGEDKEEIRSRTGRARYRSAGVGGGESRAGDQVAPVEDETSVAVSATGKSFESRWRPSEVGREVHIPRMEGSEDVQIPRIELLVGGGFQLLEPLESGRSLDHSDLKSISYILPATDTPNGVVDGEMIRDEIEKQRSQEMSQKKVEDGEGPTEGVQ
eukprot:gene2076-2474_t